MKTICHQCGHDWETPDEWVNKFHPPTEAVRMMVAGCEKCMDEDLRSGEFHWRMKDGSTKHCLAGIDELEEQGIAVL